MNLAIKKLDKSYGKFNVLQDINIELCNGLYALLAPNGAGKTTFLRILAMLLPIDNGLITVDGKNIYEMGAQYRELIGYLPQKIGYYPHYNANEYLQYIAAVKGVDPLTATERIKKLLALVHMESFSKKPMSKLSGGMLQRIGIAMALINDPKILLLDEPSAGLDVGERAEVNFLYSQLAAERIVILSTHITSDVEFTAGEIILLKNKTIFEHGSVEQLKRLVKGKVFDVEVDFDQVPFMLSKYQIVAMRKNGATQKLRLIAEKSENKFWLELEPTLEDITLYIYGKKMWSET